MAGGKLIAFSVHRWQAHLLNEGTIARVGMEKVESGVGLSQQQQEWIAFIDTLLKQGKSLIVLTELPVQVCKLESRNSRGSRPLFNCSQLATNHSTVSACFECAADSGRQGKISVGWTNIVPHYRSEPSFNEQCNHL